MEVIRGMLMNIKERAKQLMMDIPALFLSLKHKGTPWYAKLVAGLCVAYALSPIDLIPDFIPVLGYLDDVLLLPVGIALCIKWIPNEVWQLCKEQAKGLWKDGKPKKWFFAIPIICVWVLLVYLILQII